MRYNQQKKPKDYRRRFLPNGFQRGYYGCTTEQMEQVRDTLMKDLKWSRSLFYSRMRGMYSFSQEEIETVENLFRSMGVNAWTGEQIFTDECTKTK